MTSIFIPPADEFNKEYVTELINNLDSELRTNINSKDSNMKIYIDEAISKLNTDLRAYNNLTYITKTVSSNINMSGKRITNLGAPTNDKDATTKEYVDQRIVNAVRTRSVTETTPTAVRISLKMDGQAPNAHGIIVLTPAQVDFTNRVRVAYPNLYNSLVLNHRVTTTKDIADAIFLLPNAANIIRMEEIPSTTSN